MFLNSSCFTKSQGAVGLAKILGRKLWLSRGEEGWPHAHQFIAKWFGMNIPYHPWRNSSRRWMGTRQPQGPGSCWCWASSSPLTSPGSGTALQSPAHLTLGLSPFLLQLGTCPGPPAWLGIFRKEKTCCESCWQSQEAHPAPAR